jgi:hypothetical protein
MRLAKITRKKAGEILSNFVIMDIVKICSNHEGTRFSLNTDFDHVELQKFS